MLRSNGPILVGLFETAPCRKPTRLRAFASENLTGMPVSPIAGG